MKKQKRMEIYNLPDLMELAIADWQKQTGEKSRTRALLDMAVAGYENYLDASGKAWFDDTELSHQLYDEYMALPAPRPSYLDFLRGKMLPKPGRPRKEA